MWRVAIILAVLIGTAHAASAAPAWTELCPGVEYAEFAACKESPQADSKITVVRIDPAQAPLRALSSSDLGLPRPLRADAWADRYGLAVVINAGMFDTDGRHLGYMRLVNGHLNNATVRKDYKSFLVFGARVKGIREAAIVDLEDASVSDLAARYQGIVQNLRMIRSPGKVVWSPSSRRWSESALGMDRSGRILFLFCRSPYSMYDFSHCLLELPLELAAVQHLEGGGAAALVIRTPRLSKTLFGGYETTPQGRETDQGDQGAPLPNVLAVSSCATP